MAEELPKTIVADTDSPQPSSAALPASAVAEPTEAPSTASGISGNIAGVHIVPGPGQLGEALGFSPDSGVRIGGVWVGNATFLLAGGEKPAQSSFNSLLVTG